MTYLSMNFQSLQEMERRDEELRAKITKEQARHGNMVSCFKMIGNQVKNISQIASNDGETAKFKEDLPLLPNLPNGFFGLGSRREELKDTVAFLANYVQTMSPFSSVPVEKAEGSVEDFQGRIAKVLSESLGNMEKITIRSFNEAINAMNTDVAHGLNAAKKLTEELLPLGEATALLQRCLSYIKGGFQEYKNDADKNSPNPKTHLKWIVDSLKKSPESIESYLGFLLNQSLRGNKLENYILHLLDVAALCKSDANLNQNGGASDLLVKKDDGNKVELSSVQEHYERARSVLLGEQHIAVLTNHLHIFESILASKNEKLLLLVMAIYAKTGSQEKLEEALTNLQNISGNLVNALGDALLLSENASILMELIIAKASSSLEQLDEKAFKRQGLYLFLLSESMDQSNSPLMQRIGEKDKQLAALFSMGGKTLPSPVESAKGDESSSFEDLPSPPPEFLNSEERAESFSPPLFDGSLSSSSRKNSISSFREETADVQEGSVLSIPSSSLRVDVQEFRENLFAAIREEGLNVPKLLLSDDSSSDESWGESDTEDI